MRNDLLFIDGELVDLDDSTKITLNIKSNLFTDLSKIVSNNSYTIKLPKTVRNQRVIKHADLPACSTDYPRKYHSARYIRNGVEIIPNGKAVVLSISEVIEVALTWGNFVSLSNLIGEGKTLNELFSEDYVQWDSNIAISDYEKNSGVIVSKINFGFKEEETAVTYHPSVRASHIVERIQAGYGLTFRWPEEKRQVISKLIIPCLYRNGGYANQQERYCKVDIAGSQDSLLFWNKKEEGSKFGEAFQYNFATGSSIIVRSIKVLADGTMVITPNFKSKNDNLVLLYGESWIDENYQYLPYTIIDDEYPYHYNIPYEIDIQKGYFFTIGIRQGWANVNRIESNSVVFSMKPKEIQIGDKFSIAENLPKIKMIDFIKSLCYICGLFAIASEEENQLSFVSIDIIKNNKSRAKNWTKKVVASYQDNKPNKMSYILDNFAQNNRLKWKEDETVVGLFNGVIVVENNTLDLEKDTIMMPFAASDTRGGIASVPIYTYDVSGELEYETVEPRILLEQDDNGKSKGVFIGLDWMTLINQNYQTYQEMVRNPVIITEKIEISDIDLKELDVTVPVYLGQYGRYYALISVKAEDTGVCECKLLQLEV
ncbi:hypothetical protein [Bacteroides stercorirosoris]|uniref:Uncharacterized protein n=1 Tax=Bacteroides stercorirosoris TaxID=871324 RepID=A0A1M6FKP4_9BACE|nr:hypothetical protein [Bacteroides stercorirosoris]SHI98277.1 hypothetical protein SAMN05444350_11286 [Bacteroides stercorirosoris]